MRALYTSAAVIFLLDQISKYLIVHMLALREVGVIEVFPPFLRFTMAWNQGVNFGLFSNSSDVMRWVLIAVAFAVVGFVLYWVRKETPGRWAMISAGVLVGGALGNVIDRFIYGAVADFLNMSCCGIDNPYAFNVADIAIFAGALGLIIFTGGKNAA